MFNNVVKHVVVKEVLFIVVVDELVLEIEIVDDGCGLVGVGVVKFDDIVCIVIGNGL